MSNPVIVGAASGILLSTDLGVRDIGCGRVPFCFALFPGIKRFDGLTAGALLGALGLAIGGSGATVLCWMLCENRHGERRHWSSGQGTCEKSLSVDENMRVLGTRGPIWTSRYGRSHRCQPARRDVGR